MNQRGRVKVSREKNIEAIVRGKASDFHGENAATVARELRLLEGRSLSGGEIQRINGLVKRTCGLTWFVQKHERMLKIMSGYPGAQTEIQLNHISGRKSP